LTDLRTRVTVETVHLEGIMKSITVLQSRLERSSAQSAQHRRREFIWI
jgi:hypothetical protein